MSRATEERRRLVGEQWLHGVSPRALAAQFGVTLRTIFTDIAAIRAELRAQRVTDLEACRDQSLAHLRQVQASAWEAVVKAGPTSNNSIGALNTISRAEETIAKLQGTLSPDTAVNQTINILAQPDWIQARSALLAALSPFPDARGAVVAALAQIAGGADGRIIDASR